MKSFTAAVFLAVSAAVASAQLQQDPKTGLFICPIADGVYCAGTSLQTNIIIRCTNGVGQPGNCNDNLAGEPPLGVNPTTCYAPSDGKAACSKNCIVYGGSGNLNGTFPLPIPACPYVPSSSSSVSSTVITTVVTTGTKVSTVVTTICPTSTTAPPPPVSTTKSGAAPPYTIKNGTHTSSTPPPPPPPPSSTVTLAPPPPPPSTCPPPVTVYVHVTGGQTTYVTSTPPPSGTALPVGPTTTTAVAVAPFTGAAVALSRPMLAVAGAGAFVAYLL